MSQIIKSAIVRIKTADNNIIGAGFLVTERYLLTCAHVVSDALDLPRQETPGGLVYLDFPFVAPGKRVTAVVTLWQPKRPDGTGDIARLELQSPLPDGARPLRLVAASDTWNHPFRAFGFPIWHDQGVWASGVLRDRTANGHIQIEDIKTQGYSVQPGFSGTAVWDEALQAVVGMIVTVERRAEVKAAFMIPADQLREAVPVFDEWLVLRSELATLQATIKHALQQLLLGNRPLPQLADDLWEITRQIEKYSPLLVEHISQTGMDSHHLARLQYVSELTQANQDMIHILRKLLRQFHNGERYQYQNKLVTQLNRMMNCLEHLEHFLT